eukprot:355907-Rhodomonas_salina.4
MSGTATDLPSGILLYRDLRTTTRWTLSARRCCTMKMIATLLGRSRRYIGCSMLITAGPSNTTTWLRGRYPPVQNSYVELLRLRLARRDIRG